MKPNFPVNVLPSSDRFFPPASTDVYELIRGQLVSSRGFLVRNVKRKKERVGRDPVMKAVWNSMKEIEDRFKAAQKLQARVRGAQVSCPKRTGQISPAVVRANNKAGQLSVSFVHDSAKWTVFVSTSLIPPREPRFRHDPDHALLYRTSCDWRFERSDHIASSDPRFRHPDHAAPSTLRERPAQTGLDPCPNGVQTIPGATDDPPRGRDLSPPRRSASHTARMAGLLGERPGGANDRGQ